MSETTTTTTKTETTVTTHTVLTFHVRPSERSADTRAEDKARMEGEQDLDRAEERIAELTTVYNALYAAYLKIAAYNQQLMDKTRDFEASLTTLFYDHGEQVKALEADNARLSLRLEKAEEALPHSAEEILYARDWRERAEKAEREKEALQADRARMDFQETIPAEIRNGEIIHSCFYGGGRYTAKTKREAIDKARQAKAEADKAAGESEGKK